jgi:cyclophilin family peptidyl-prolyl cis-trans isomerase
MATIPIITQPIDDVVIPENAADTIINLFQHFDDPFTTGKIARFELADTSLGGGITNVLLFDQTGFGAPATVTNFLNYVNDGDYVNSIIHRSIPGFVIQGGGFTVEDLDIETVSTDPPVVNEFNAERSNTRGTIAMAKLGNDPNSATSEWFFNLADNSANLDNQNGGFTVFGEVLSDLDLAPIDAIANLPWYNASSYFNQSAFTNLPLNFQDSGDQAVDDDEDFVRYSNISVLQADELEFKILNNSNPDLVNVTLNEGELLLDYTDNQSGRAEIIIQATDLLGDSVIDTFNLTIGDVEPYPSNQGATIYRFLNNDTGVHLYTSSEVERNYIFNNLPNYVSEGLAYASIDTLTGSPEPQKVYRFLNRDTGTHLYTISEVEKESVEANLDNFNLESESFFAYAEAQPDTIPVYRFYNTQTGAHFYTPSELEKSVVEDTLPNYQSEGIAYYALPI